MATWLRLSGYHDLVMGALSIAETTFPYRPLGRRIAELRDAQRWSQRELAEYANVNPGYLPRIETGRNRPSPEHLRAIARALGADYAELAALAGYADAVAEGEPMIVPGWLRRHVEQLRHLPERAVEVGVETAGRFAEALGTWAEPDVAGERRRRQEAERQADRDAQRQADEAKQDQPQSPDSARGA